MAKKKKRTKAPTSPAPVLSPAARALQKARKERQEASRAAWAARHPQLAKQERAMRKARISEVEQFGHKRHGTVQTLAQANRKRQGSVARLFESGAIDREQLQAGVDIASAAERIMADVTVRTASLETRVDLSAHDGVFWESLGAVRREAAYSSWRGAIAPHASLVLAIVVEDVGIAAAAARHRMGKKRARAILIDALDRWISHFAEARRQIDPAALAAAQAAIL